MSTAVVPVLEWPPDVQERLDQKTPGELQEWLQFNIDFDRRERRKHNRVRKNWIRDFGVENDLGPYMTINQGTWISYKRMMAIHDERGYYTLLGLTATADLTKKDVKNAYRRQARKLHPDVGGSEEAFKALHTAYRTVLAVTPKN